MKGRNSYIIMGVVLSALLIGCGSKDQKSSSVSDINSNSAELSSSTVSEENTNDLFDVPAGMCREYEKADFAKYNSYASENGLGGDSYMLKAN